MKKKGKEKCSDERILPEGNTYSSRERGRERGGKVSLGANRLLFAQTQASLLSLRREKHRKGRSFEE